jgi:ATP phosphoribosyltransferase
VPPTATTGVVEVLDLDFGKCSLQVQVPQKGDLAKPEDLIGKNVVTSFTNLAEQYFRKLEAEQSGATNGDAKDAKLKTNIKYVGGSVEAACALGVADGIVDLVESGETMRAAGLKAISTVVSSSAILIKSKHPSDPKLVDLITARIKGVISKPPFLTLPFHPLSLPTNVSKPPKSTSSASTTSSARSSTSQRRSHRATARRPLLRSKRAAGSLSPLWCRGSRLLLLWTG